MKMTAFPVSRLQSLSWSGPAARVPAFITLMKPRVMVLAVFTAGVGLFIAPGEFDPLLLWAPGVLLGLAVLAIAQMGVYLVFFLHITTGPDSTGNVLALALGTLIVILVAAGSIWIIANLNDTMMSPPELMVPHTQH